MFAVLPWKWWFGLYAAAFLVLMTLGLSDLPGWVWWSWAMLYMLFAVVTDPAPRRSAKVRAGCECAPCVRMRARHKRRSTDVKDAG